MSSQDDEEFSIRRYLNQAKAEMEAKTNAHENRWQISKTTWSIDRDRKIIKFKNQNLDVITAAVQIIGTYDTAEESWIWGWDNPYVSRGMDDHARKMLAFGKEHSIPQLLQRKFKCPEKVCWDFAALACKLCISQGVYRGIKDTNRIFMTFESIKITPNG